MDRQVSSTPAPINVSCWLSPWSPGARRSEILLDAGFCAAPYLVWWKAHASGPWWCLPRFCGGLYLDIKRKLPWFPSDFYEGFHIQSISAILFIYLGCITNAITFGGLLGDATDNYQVESKERGSLWLGDSKQGWDGTGWDGMGWVLPFLCHAKL